MRTVLYGAACSLDGFMAGADGAIDWLHFSADVRKIMADTWSRFDTILMGRKTWIDAQAQGGGGDSATAGLSTYVFSRTLPPDAAPGATIVSTDAGAFVRDLKGRPGKGICMMGGGELASSLFAAGLIDEVGLNIHPIVLGSGIPFFRDPGRRIPLTLTESRVIDGGCVLATYRVKHGVPNGAGMFSVD
jgi:dihydrofolate reductase